MNTNNSPFSLPVVRMPCGYCVHKHPFGSKGGLLTKLELFAYFEHQLLAIIQKRSSQLEDAPKHLLPLHFSSKGKHTQRHRCVKMWHKSPVLIKFYTQQRDGICKLEVTRARWKRGRKFLDPIATLNSLGDCIRFLTDNTETVDDKTHSTFWFVPEFLSVCHMEFTYRALHGQLRLLQTRKLRTDLRFGMQQSQVSVFRRYIRGLLIYDIEVLK